jgi:hypothetical protein
METNELKWNKKIKKQKFKNGNKQLKMEPKN